MEHIIKHQTFLHQAENSALVLANESQREAYERCLDEVANHVVQALLNQKDLREECIKLKMLVFDLERQNRALCELFQQKLEVWASLLRVPPPRPPPPPPDKRRKMDGYLNLSCPAGNGFCTQHVSPGPRAPAASMEALSPFFKKKAHILEVLRKMEETDPLKFHPSTASLSFCDYSQVLMSTEAVLATADPLPRPCKSHLTHCRCSCSETDAHQHFNGDGAVKCDGGNAWCSHCKRSPDSPPKPCGHVCSPSKASQSHVVPAAAALGECHSKTRAPQSVAPSKPCTANEAHQLLAAAHSSTSEPLCRNKEAVKPKQDLSDVSEELSATAQTPGSVKESMQATQCDAGTSDGVYNGTETSDPSAFSEKDGTETEASSTRASASVSPSPSCLSDVKAAAINSPSKLLKFLKIPSIGEKSQASPPAVRLSPQLTRNSRIPCRTNNYEVYHSPVPTRKATTTERCRQPPTPPARSESYPATHSAPTSPPFSASKGKSVMHPSPQRRQSSSSSDSTSDEEEDSDSPVWVNHHSLPPSAVLSKAQNRADYPRMREKQEADMRDAGAPSSEVTQPAPPSRRSDCSSIPKRPAGGAARGQTDSSHHAFKDRLAALGKLRSSEDLQASAKSVDTNEGPCAEERSKAVERPAVVQRDEQRLSKYADCLEGKPKGGAGLKYPAPSQLYEQALKQQSCGPAKQEPCPTKPDVSRSKIGLLSPNADAPQVLRNNMKCPGSLNLPYNVKPGVSTHSSSSSSPNKIPQKSPSKPCPGPSVHRGGKPPETPRYSSKSEERIKIGGKGKKNPMYGDSLPPPPPRPPTSEGERSPQPVPSLQSAIEQKVMKGIEENVLKLQEQDRGGQGAEVKQKTSNGIASWFGLKKSKLPALSRKADAAKAKDEKKEWKINIPSVGRDSVKVTSRCKEGVEGLNISTLMEKAEGLRRALEEERAYVERSGRGHSCEVVMDQAQGQLAVMYRGGRSDNFMQQLLNR
uniref:NCK-associated protein 5-like n=1 Tax=Oryzias sinensis TaxID=183150 RepID=A0A8C7Y3A2_9TELE